MVLSFTSFAIRYIPTNLHPINLNSSFHTISNDLRGGMRGLDPLTPFSSR
jgi:hypothetical protein